MDILKKIDTLRKERGWSINNLAMEALLTQSTLNNLYSRNAEPKLSTLRAICSAFGITLSEFFAEDEEEAATLHKKTDEELHKCIDALSDTQKAALLTLLRSDTKND